MPAKILYRRTLAHIRPSMSVDDKEMLWGATCKCDKLLRRSLDIFLNLIKFRTDATDDSINVGLDLMRSLICSIFDLIVI